MQRFFLALGLILLAGYAIAQSVNTVEVDTTVGATSVNCVPNVGALVNGSPIGAKKILTLWNLNATNTVYYAINGTPVAVANTAGSLPIAPNSGAFWPFGSVPAGPINCIATGVGTAVSAVIGQ